MQQQLLELTCNWKHDLIFLFLCKIFPPEKSLVHPNKTMVGREWAPISASYDIAVHWKAVAKDRK